MQWKPTLVARASLKALVWPVKLAAQASRYPDRVKALRPELPAGLPGRLPRSQAADPCWVRRLAYSEPLAAFRLKGVWSRALALAPTLMELTQNLAWTQHRPPLHPDWVQLSVRFAGQPRDRSTRFPEKTRAMRCQARAPRIRCQLLRPAPSSQRYLPARRPSRGSLLSPTAIPVIVAGIVPTLSTEAHV